MGTTSALLTVDDFLKLPDDGQRIELIQGEVVSMGRGGFPHEMVKSNLIEILGTWIRSNRIGRVFSETMFRLDENDSLQPDVSILLKQRIVPGTQGVFRAAPDLAIEIVSSETAAYLLAKIELYLKHGSKTVWVFYPDQQQVYVYCMGGQIARLTADQMLEDREVLPGFTVPVGEIFEGL